MIVELDRLDSHPRKYSFAISPDLMDLEMQNGRLTRDVVVEAELVRRAAQVDVKGHIDVSAEFDCVRCLESVALELPIDFEVDYVSEEYFSSDKEHEIGSSEMSTDVLKGEEIDLNDIVREQVLLNVPDRVFCKPECKGICDQCGSNLNLIDCSCKENQVDPRWSALKNLK
jgi:uncharacterized protein